MSRLISLPPGLGLGSPSAPFSFVSHCSCHAFLHRAPTLARVPANMLSRSTVSGHSLQVLLALQRFPHRAAQVFRTTIYLWSQVMPVPISLSRLFLSSLIRGKRLPYNPFCLSCAFCFAQRCGTQNNAVLVDVSRHLPKGCLFRLAFC